MKNTLWVFGDSFSEDPRGLPPNSSRIQYVNQYLDGKFYNTWSYYLAKKLNLKLVNKAANGGDDFFYMSKGNDNTSIFSNLANQSNLFKKGDYVFIGLTSVFRFPWVEPSGTVSVVMPNLYPDSEEKEFFDKLLVEKDSDFYREEIFYRIKLLESFAKSVGFKLYVWSWNGEYETFLVDNNLKSDSFLLTKIENYSPMAITEYLRMRGCSNSSIAQQTNGKINDCHFSNNGEYEVYKLFLELINKK